MRRLAQLSAGALALILVTGFSAPVSAQAATPGAADYGRMLEFGRALAEQEKYADACVKFWQILQSGAEIDLAFKEAEYELAVNLYHLELYLAAYTYLERIADAGTAHPRYVDALRWLLDIHRKVPGDMSALEKIASYDPSVYPADVADELYFMAGQYNYYEGELDLASELLGKVDRGNEEFFLKARYLAGVVFVRQNKAKPALEAFKDILRYERDSGSDSELMDKFSQMATLSLARIFYSTRQYATAVRYYDRVEEFSPNWLDALFEVSWSYFRLENHGRALGNLHTLSSPYFEEEYFPEAQVLQAVILFYNCRYDDTIEVIDGFIKDYWQLKKELETQLGSYSDPNEFYLFLARLSSKGGEFSLRLKRIFNAALSDSKLSRLFGLVIHLNKEVEGLTKLKGYAPAHDLADMLVGDAIAYRELVIGEAGELARSRLQRVHADLKGLLAQALKVKFETLAKQKRLLAGKTELPDVEAPAPRVDSEHLGWKFRGEYWKDELGSYIYKIASQCPAGEEPKGLK